MVTGARMAYAALAWLFVVGVVVQVFFIGLTLFVDKQNLELHRSLGWILHLSPILILAAAALGRVGRAQILTALALAIVVFAGWNPWGALAGAWLFGGVTVLQLRLQAAGVAVPVQLLSMAPYLATILVLVLISARQTYARGGGGTAPGSLGRPFHALR